MRMGKHAEALGETRSLTVEGESAAAEVLAVRAEALYGSGNMERAMKMYEEVHYPLPQPDFMMYEDNQFPCTKVKMRARRVGSFNIDR